MANTSNASTLTTNFNVTPYYDDYDASNGYYRILYKPGYAVQARELTQSQTILQKQIDRFGKHIFKEGSIVLPGAFSLESNYGSVRGDAIPYVKVKDLDTSNNEVSIDEFYRETIVGQTSNISAYIVEVADGVEGDSNTKTLFVRYQTTSDANSSIKVFQPGETLVSNTGQTLIVLDNDPVANTGLGSRFQIEEGVFFAKEHFISFPTSSVILDKYNPNPSCKVGFFVTETIIDSTQDASLLDPALESSNFSAPGADRLKLIPELTVRPYDDPIGPPDFVTLFTIKNGVIQVFNERSQYNIIRDEIAKRTFDESGDYYVNGLTVQIREHDDNGSNFGRYANGNNQLLFVGVDPGTAYVKGYEIKTYDITELETEKGIAFSGANNQIISTTMGSYVTVNELVGSWELDKGNIIYLYDVAQNRISEKKWSISAQTGNNIGSAILHSIEYISGTPGYDATYNVYLADIKMQGSNTFSSVKSLYLNNSPHSDLGSDIILNAANNASLQGLNDSSLMYYVGSDYTKNVKTIGTTSSDTTFYFNKTSGVASTIQVDAGGLTSVSTSGDEIFPYGTTSLGASDKRDITLTLSASINIALPGTVSGSGTTLNGLSTSFTRLNVGDKLEFEGLSNTVYITAITNNTTLTVNETLPAELTGNSLFKAYKTGDNIDLTGKGSDAGTTRTVSATPTQLNIDLKETFGSAVDCTITYKLARTSAVEISKTLNPDRYVIINTGTAVGGLTGPYSLGFSDIYRVKKIVLKNGSAPTTLNDGTDVTSSFIIDNGQRDTHYELGSIIPKSSLASGDYLLVQLDYFSPNFSSRAGYFSIDSYPIQDDDLLADSTTIRTEQIPVYLSSTSGLRYDLRNYLDFRPIKSITATDATSIGSASTNPSSTASYAYSTGLRFPVPSTEVTYDYMYYLSRKDIVVVDRNGVFSITKGVPSVSPMTPVATENQMVIAALDITPYPSLSPAYANSLNKKNFAVRTRKLSNVRFTMRDIGVLRDRIQNLEYYTSLSLLEKSAYDLRILDDAGLDRFKNGIFVDTFRDHLLGASENNPDYRIVVDEEEMSIRPIYTMESFYYDYLSGTNVVKNGPLVTLDYDEVDLITQTNVTNIRNLERNSYHFVGNMTLSPEQDIWIETSYASDEAVSIHSANSLISVGTSTENADELALVTKNIISVTWGAWSKYATGYVVYTGTGDAKVQVGTFSTYAQARTEANRYTNTTAVTIETLWNNVRSGIQRFSLSSYDEAGTGYKVIDTSEIPYIKSQTIHAYCRGLKPNSLMRAFFDGIEVTSYITPLTETQYNAYIAETTPQGELVEGADLIVDANGLVYFNFRIDENLKFRTGVKTLILMDALYTPSIESGAIPEDATTGAKAVFVAKGTKVTKQRTIYSTSGYVEAEEDVQGQYSSNSFEIIPRVVPQGGRSSCIAYSFLPRAPLNDEGVFLTSVDVFIARKSATRGVWFEIREMSPDGNITRSQVPFSEVWITNNNIPVSTDGISNPLTVTFPSPVFLMNDIQYAFVVHSENADPDTYVWVSKTGEVDVNTNQQVVERPWKGTFYSTNNNLNWDIVPDVDLVCNFRRADFPTNVQGSAIIGNKPVERFYLSNISLPLSARTGDVFTSGDRLTLSGANGTISLTDRLLGNVTTTNANGSVVSVISGTEYAMSNTNYVAGESVSAYYAANGLYTGVTATVSSVANTRATLSFYKETSVNTFADFIKSSGNFLPNDTIRSLQSNSHFATIDSIKDFKYSVASFEPSYISFNNTEISFEMRTYANGSTSQGSYFNIDPSITYYFNSEQALSSRSNEITNLSGNRSNQVRVNMRTTSNSVSPALDLDRTHNIYINNIINANTSGETNPTGGSIFNKYISKTITLADGQDAEDILVSLTSYRPPSTDVKIWVKILHAEDGETFAQKNWIELEKQGDGDITYSSVSNRNDFKEYTYKFPTSYMTGINGAVLYTNASATEFSGFKYFAVKIGLTGTNAAVVPRVADLKCIALQL